MMRPAWCPCWGPDGKPTLGERCPKHEEKFRYHSRRWSAWWRNAEAGAEPLPAGLPSPRDVMTYPRWYLRFMLAWDDE